MRRPPDRKIVISLRNVAGNLAAFNLVAGLIWALEPALRLSSASYTEIKKLAPVPVFGWVMVAVAVFMLVRSQLFTGRVPWGMILGGAYWLFWAGTFWVSAHNDPRAGWTGAWTCFGMGLGHLIVAVAAERHTEAAVPNAER